MKKVLFICTGNICRSALAEGIFNHQIKQKKAADAFVAISAGMYVTDNEKASHHAIEVLKPMQIDITGHRSKGVNEVFMEEAFIVITMTRAHKNALRLQYPQHGHKVFTFHEYTEGDASKDVEDPYGMPASFYMACSNDLSQGIEKLIEKLEAEKKNSEDSTNKI